MAFIKPKHFNELKENDKADIFRELVKKNCLLNQEIFFLKRSLRDELEKLEKEIKFLPFEATLQTSFLDKFDIYYLKKIVETFSLENIIFLFDLIENRFKKEKTPMSESFGFAIKYPITFMLNKDHFIKHAVEEEESLSEYKGVLYEDY